MSALMSIGLRAMTANYAALQTTGHNIANANVDGYSRQDTEFATATGQFTGAGFFGKGVDVVGVRRAHDEFLSRRPTWRARCRRWIRHAPASSSSSKACSPPAKRAWATRSATSSTPSATSSTSPTISPPARSCWRVPAKSPNASTRPPTSCRACRPASRRT
jgi:hypothetical protein